MGTHHFHTLGHEWILLEFSTQSCQLLRPQLQSMGFPRQEYCSGLPFPSSGDLPWPRDQIQVSCIAGRFFTIWAATLSLQQFNYNSGFPTEALVSKAVSAYESALVNFGSQYSPDSPFLKDNGLHCVFSSIIWSQNCWFFRLLYVVKLKWWLLSSLHAELETQSLLFFFFFFNHSYIWTRLGLISRFKYFHL